MDFFSEYLLDEEEIDPRAGGGDPMTIGQMVSTLLSWYRISAVASQRIRSHTQNVQPHFSDLMYISKSAKFS